MSEAFDLVHDALAETNSSEAVDEAHFLHGATISWRELDRSADVRRAGYPQLLELIKNALSNSRTLALTLLHTPGAGGSTLARRAAWELRDTYPVIVLRRWSDISSDRIGLLGELTNLPILAIVEGGVLSEGQRERLFLDARSRQIRLVNSRSDSFGDGRDLVFHDVRTG